MRVSVLAEIEDYDDTTTAIVWVVEQKYPELTSPTLEIEETPIIQLGRRSFEPIEYQKGRLTGWTKNHERVDLRFSAEPIDIPLGCDQWDSGYTVVIEKTEVVFRDKTVEVEEKPVVVSMPCSITKPVAKITLRGCCREEFKIIKEE